MIIGEKRGEVFLMFALYLVYKNECSSIPEVRELIISNFSALYGEDYKFETETEAMLYFVQNELVDGDVPDRVKEEAVSLLRKAERELSGVISSM